MTINELIQEIWDNYHREDKKRYLIKNKDYDPTGERDEAFYFGYDIPSDLGHFGVGVITSRGFFEIVKNSFDDCFGFEDLCIFAYDGLGQPRALSIKLIESENWQLIEDKGEEANPHQKREQE